MKNTINPYFKTFLGQYVILNIHTHTKKKKQQSLAEKQVPGSAIKHSSLAKKFITWVIKKVKIQNLREFPGSVYP